MKAVLLFPPQWIPYQPYLSLPSLSAFLKQHGVDVAQMDLNIEAFDIFFSKDYLLTLSERLGNEFSRLNSKPELRPGFEQQYYNDLFIANNSLRQIAEDVENAKKVFRSSTDYYDANSLSAARETLKKALAVISTAHFPTRLDLLSFEMGAYQRSLKDIKKSTADKNQNPFIKLYEEKMIPAVLKQKPDVIGISIAGESQLIPALTLARQLKALSNNTHIVIGGHVVTLLADVITHNPELFRTFFDSAIINEGERPLLELVECLQKGSSLKNIPNLIYFDETVKSNKPLPAPKMDSMPTPCFDGLKLEKYLSPEPILPILASRGCYWGKCAFCSHNEAYSRQYQSGKAEKVARDIQLLAIKHNVKNFSFVDEGLSPSLANELSEELINQKININCSTNVRLEKQFTPKLCEKMHRAGFQLLTLGVESGCDRILTHMEKGVDSKTATKVCRNIYEAGIWNHLYIFFGFPSEKRNEAQETIDFLTSNKDIIRSFNIDHFILGMGSAVLANPQKFGISHVKDGPENEFRLSREYSVSSGLTDDEAKRLSNSTWHKLTNEHQNKHVFKLLVLNDILPYLSQYENAENLLNSLKPRQQKRELPTEVIGQLSTPLVEKTLVLSEINYDIAKIQRNILKNSLNVITPTEISVVYNPKSGVTNKVSPPSLDILRICDGKTSIKQVAAILSSRYNAPKEVIEADCISFLQTLLEKQLISI